MLLSTSWYVATSGSNSNPGTLAAPFQTIQFAANKAHAGDTVLVRAGTYHEDVTVPNSGTSAAKITFEPYNNESVTIDGADPIKGWTNTIGSIWTASMPTNLGVGMNQVFVDGQMMNEARWPNTPLILPPAKGFDLSNPTLETAPSITASMTSFTINDPKLTQATGFWVGATLRIGSGADWVNQTGTVTSSGPGFVTVAYTPHDPTYTIPKATNKYYLYGVAGALDSAGEWFRSSSGKLSLWTPAGDSPNNHTVEVKTRTYGFNLGSASNIKIQGFHLFACSIYTTYHSTVDVINAITSQFANQFATSAQGFLPPGQTGIILAGNNDVLSNSVIADTAGDGVFINASYVSVTNDVIHDTDYAGVDCAPIRVGGYGDSVVHNTCYNTGRDGILFSGNHDTITNNNVYDYGLQTTDLGGFYSAGYNGHGTVIAYNKFHDAILPTSTYGATGIMLDNASSGFIVERNIIWNVNAGFRVNGTPTDGPSNLQFYNNTVDATQYSMDKDGFQTDDWSTILFENNIFTHPIEFGLNVQLIDNISNHNDFTHAFVGDFSLAPGAPAIDTGMVVPPYTNGYVGSAPDVGALEYGLPVFTTGANYSLIPKDPTGG
ncbi:MAG TPA: right-handed parallel beta-helix repeat-containing protein [Tepidisphaeraceae bacterium]|nr:right-handed parallel beta-helix repeat-containing protein [Tepidisphaeraceae bacterium]